MILGNFFTVVFMYCFLSHSDTEAGEKAAKEEAVVENATPDYAAGLVSTQVFTEISCRLF